MSAFQGQNFVSHFPGPAIWLIKLLFCSFQTKKKEEGLWVFTSVNFYKHVLPKRNLSLIFYNFIRNIPPSQKNEYYFVAYYGYANVCHVFGYAIFV